MFTQLRTRVLVSGISILVVVTALVMLTVIERRNLSASINRLVHIETARGTARELSLYVQYNAHDTNAYALGHLEHRQEFDEHAATFRARVAALQQAIADGMLDDDESELVETITQVREQYDEIALHLFAAADTNRNTPSATNQALEDTAWQEADEMGDQLDTLSQDLAAGIQDDLDLVEDEIAARNRLMVTVLVGTGFGLIALLLLLFGFVNHALGGPLSQLLAAIAHFTAGDYTSRVAVQSNDEIGTIGKAFNALAATVEQHNHTLVRLEVVETARAEAETARQTVTVQLATIEAQRDMIRDLSVPVLPVASTTLVMPLVGILDTERLALVQTQALAAIERTSARFLIIDVTGVPVLDREVARGLNHIIATVGLLGAKVVLVGIRPEVAQAIVGMGVQIGHIATRATLESGIAHALNN